MLDFRSYLINAYRDWIEDSGMTPYILVKAENAQVPKEHVKDGRIVLNVRTAGVKDWVCSPNGISFETRFSGRAFPIFVPIDAVLGIYARENGEGAMFGEAVVLSDHAHAASEEGATAAPAAPEPPKKSPGLKLVK